MIMVQAEDEALVAQVKGPVLRPGDDGFTDEAASVNTATPYEPDVIIGATGATDVQAAIRYAAARGLPVGVLATGHGPAAPVRGGVLITTRRMTGASVDPGTRTARVEAGVCAQQVADAAAEYGLAPLTGSAPTAGVVGYTLGGGLSVTMGRAHGWASDQVRAIEVVTADGVLRRATADSEPDLFWALRGGKSNFGVVTAIEFGLFPVERLYAGGLFFPGAHMADVLRAYLRLARTAPDTLMSSVAVIRFPDAPAVPEPLRGTMTVHVRISYLGDAAAGAELVAPLRAAAPTVLDTVVDRPTTTFGEIAPGPPVPSPSVGQFALLREVTTETVDALLAAAGPGASPAVALVDLRHLGGALTRPGGPATGAVDGMDAEFLVILATAVPPGGGETRVSAGTELLDALEPWLSDHKHANFLAPWDADPHRTRHAFAPDTYMRLRAVKAAVDPDNMFRMNHNIPPG
jgi:FAD/FMN-containing dehydrogenase